VTRRTLPLLLAAAVLVPGTEALAAPKARPVPPRVVSASYYGFSFYGVGSLTWRGGATGELIGDGGVGAVAVPLKPGDVAVGAVTSDASGQTAGGGLIFFNTSGARMLQVYFCGALPSSRIPVGAASADVYLDPNACPGLVTTGTVRLTIAQRQPTKR
jgi:hypothetical protein